MAISFPEAEQLIKDGKALAPIRRFIYGVNMAAVAVRNGQMEEPEGFDDMVVAAVALVQLKATKDGRKLLGIRATNAVYDAADVRLASPKMEIARRLGMGELSREAALEELRQLLENAGTAPKDDRTLHKLLSGLEKQAIELRENIDMLMSAANWDGTPEDVRRILHDLTSAPSKPGRPTR